MAETNNERTLFETIADGLDACVDGRGYDANHHRAVRLANASPKLLEALKVLHAYTQSVDSSYRNPLRPTDEHLYTWVDAAIAEAEGR